jgi:hypothetical protein
MDLKQQICEIACNRRWRLTWVFRQADVTWFCDVTLQTGRTNYECTARGRNKKRAESSAAYELAARLVQDGVLDVSEVKGLQVCFTFVVLPYNLTFRKSTEIVSVPDRPMVKQVSHAVNHRILL